MHQNFQHQSYLIRKKFLKLLGEDFHIFSPSGELVFYAKLKPFAWKEEITVYTDETKTQACLTIKARHVLDFSATYDVIDAITQERVGALRRKGFKSLLHDEWLILDADDREIGRITEDDILLAVIRRVLLNLIPQEFEGFIGNEKVMHLKQNFNPFVTKINLEFTSDTKEQIDRRIGIAAGILLNAIEGRQE